MWPKMAGCLMSDDLEGMCKETVVTSLKGYSGICLEGLRNTAKQLNENT